MRRYAVEIGGRTHTIDVEEITAERFRVRVGSHDFELRLSQAEEVSAEIAVTPEIVPAGALAAPPPYRPPALESLPPVPTTAPPPLAPAPPAADEAAADVRAPMPGTVVSVEVQPGATVRRGDTLLKLEAMKMINHVRAHRDGVVAEVKPAPGQSVGFGEVLVTFVQDTP